MAKVVIEQTDPEHIGPAFVWWKVVLFGAILGCIWWGLTLAVEHTVVDPLVCQGDDLSGCARSFTIAGNIAAIVTAIIGVVGLVRLSVFRPLIVASAALVALWGLSGVVTGLAWQEAFGWSVLLYVLAYSVFSWLARVVRTVPMIFVVVALVVIVRIVLML